MIFQHRKTSLKRIKKLSLRSSLDWSCNLIILVVLLSFVYACANNPLSSYSANISPPLEALKDGDIALAENSVPQAKNVLYYLEHGTILRLSDNYKASNDDFTSAQGYIDAWISSFHNGTLGQGSDALAASLVNDKINDYIVKDYEKVMLPTYKALNYVALNDFTSARVEITRMYNLEDIIQNFRSQQYAQEQDEMSKRGNFPNLDQMEAQNQKRYNFNTINSPQVLALRNSYQNAFSHYLAGFIFEALGEPSLARPGYIKAGELNPNNQLIMQSINSIDTTQAKNDGTTDLLLVEEVGHAPTLKSVSFNVPFNTSNGQNTCVNVISIAFPELVVNKETYTSNGLSVDNTIQPTILFTDFNLMAARYLHDNLPNVFLRNTMRAAKDVALQQSACGSGGSIGSLIAAVSGVMLGSADERTWAMLPGQIYVGRLRLKYGVHTIKVRNGNSEQAIKVNLNNRYAILTWRVIGSGVYFSPEQSMLR